jgi:hypothetical protein
VQLSARTGGITVLFHTVRVRRAAARAERGSAAGRPHSGHTGCRDRRYGLVARLAGSGSRCSASQRPMVRRIRNTTFISTRSGLPGRSLLSCSSDLVRCACVGGSCKHNDGCIHTSFLLTRSAWCCPLDVGTLSHRHRTTRTYCRSTDKAGDSSGRPSE